MRRQWKRKRERTYQPTQPPKPKQVAVDVQSILIPTETGLEGELSIALKEFKEYERALAYPELDYPEITHPFEPFVVRVTAEPKTHRTKESKPGRHVHRYSPTVAKLYFDSFQPDDSHYTHTDALRKIQELTQHWYQHGDQTKQYRKHIWANFLRNAMGNSADLQHLLVLHAVASQIKNNQGLENFFNPFSNTNRDFSGSFDHIPSNPLQARIKASDSYRQMKRDLSIPYGVVELQWELNVRKARSERYKKRKS